MGKRFTTNHHTDIQKVNLRFKNLICKEGTLIFVLLESFINTFKIKHNNFISLFLFFTLQPFQIPSLQPFPHSCILKLRLFYYYTQIYKYNPLKLFLLIGCLWHCDWPLCTRWQWGASSLCESNSLFQLFSLLPCLRVQHCEISPSTLACHSWLPGILSLTFSLPSSYTMLSEP